jgi:hypothetical protein
MGWVGECPSEACCCRVWSVHAGVCVECERALLTGCTAKAAMVYMQPWHPCPCWAWG